MAVPLAPVRVGVFVLLGLGVVTLGGCSPPPTPTFPVSGKVVWQKKALTTGTVTFIPDDKKGNTQKESAVGTIGADGTYTLKTNGRDGAPLGWYKVAISPLAPPGTDVPPAEGKINLSKEKAAPKGPEIPAKYQKGDTSGISIEVKESAPSGAYDIELK